MIETQTLGALCRVYKTGQRLPETVFVDGKNVSTHAYLDGLTREHAGLCDPETTALLFAELGVKSVRTIAEALLTRALASGQLTDPKPIEPAPLRVRTAHDALTALALRHRREEAIPATIQVGGVEMTPAAALESLRLDRSTCDQTIVVNIGLARNPCQVNEAAISLAGRIKAQPAGGAAGGRRASMIDEPEAPPFGLVVRDDPLVKVIEGDDYKTVVRKPRPGVEVTDAASLQRWHRATLPKRRWIAAEIVREPATCALCGERSKRPYRMAHDDIDVRLIACACCRLVLIGGRAVAHGTIDEKRSAALEAARYSTQSRAMASLVREQVRDQKCWSVVDNGFAFLPRGTTDEDTSWHAEIAMTDEKWGFTIHLPDCSTDEETGFATFTAASEAMIEAYIHWTSR